MRGLERAGRKNDFPARSNLLDFLALAVFDPDRAFAFEKNPGGVRIGFDAQIGTLAHVRMQVAPRGAPALAIVLCQLVGAEAFLLIGIEIVAQPELRLARR